MVTTRWSTHNNSRCGVAAAAIVLLATLLAASSSPIGNNNVLQYYPLDDPEAVCIAGHPAGVYAYVRPLYMMLSLSKFACLIHVRDTQAL